MKRIIQASMVLLLLLAGLLSAQPGFDEAKSLWANRGDKASLQQAISIYEKAYQENPSYDLAERLAYACYFLADAFETGDQKAKDYYKGYEFGLGALKYNPDFKRLMEQEGKNMAEAVTVLGKDYKGGIFWTATCIGKWGKMQGIFKTIKSSKQARRMVEYLYKLDKDYYYGGPPRWLGTYFAVAPGMFGGDEAKAKQMYDEAMAMYPNYFATKVLMAENYAAKIKDKAMYDKLLDEVLSGDADAIPEVAIEQKVEQGKAQKLKAKNID